MPREVDYPFLKGHGTENDFVLLPDHDGSVHGELTAERVRALCDRRRGIGADGVLRVVRGDHGWFMDYRNADGSTSEMCGNGIRVFAHHLVSEELVDPDAPIPVGTRDGTKSITRSSTRDGDLYTVDLGPALVHGKTTVAVGERTWAARHVTTGNPHAVAVVDDLADAGPLEAPPTYDPELFPDGVNIHFVVRRGDHYVAMRPYERGSGADPVVRDRRGRGARGAGGRGRCGVPHRRPRRDPPGRTVG